MRPSARVQAAIEILDAVIAACHDEGPAADTLMQRYFASRRYAGSSDRSAVRNLVYDAIRFTAERPTSGRAALLGLAEAERPGLLDLFDGSPHAPAPPDPGEPRALPSDVPAWLRPALRERFGDDIDREIRALVDRAPLDIRLNPLRADPDLLGQQLEAELGACRLRDIPYPDSLPLARRLPQPRSLDRHPRFLDGSFEIQDAGSQFVAEMAAVSRGDTVLDLCAGAGGKTLALAADMALTGRLIATDTDRRRLEAMAPRLVRAGADGFVERRLLDPGREAEALADLAGQFDTVLVDAPCSGSGTWRRSPELRWRLTPDRLDRLLALQARLIALAAGLVKPGGRVVYAVCSVLPAEGEGQMARLPPDLAEEDSRAVSPWANGCDGFFVAKLRRRC